MPDPETLIWLTGGRWFMPLLALLSREQGARFAAMAGRLGIARSMLAKSLEQLAGRGWVMRNPGHGHPLRPEYILTNEGRTVGAWCETVMAERERLRLSTGDLTRWSLPLVRRLDRRWARFSALQSELEPISPRSLSLGLKQLMESRLVERRLEDAFPPLPLYGLTGRGQRLAHAMA